MNFIKRQPGDVVFVLTGVVLIYTGIKIANSFSSKSTDEIDEHLVKGHKNFAYAALWPLSMLIKLWLRKKPNTSVKTV